MKATETIIEGWGGNGVEGWPSPYSNPPAFPNLGRPVGWA